MNDRIAQMALEAGLVDYVTEQGQLITDYGTINEELRNFARLVAEDCAKVCDAEQKKNENDGAFMWEARHCAENIRARYK